MDWKGGWGYELNLEIHPEKSDNSLLKARKGKPNSSFDYIYISFTIFNKLYILYSMLIFHALILRIILEMEYRSKGTGFQSFRPSLNTRFTVKFKLLLNFKSQKIFFFMLKDKEKYLSTKITIHQK
jgi:hypothetical protein